MIDPESGNSAVPADNDAGVSGDGSEDTGEHQPIDPESYIVKEGSMTAEEKDRLFPNAEGPDTSARMSEDDISEVEEALKVFDPGAPIVNKIDDEIDERKRAEAIKKKKDAEDIISGRRVQ